WGLLSLVLAFLLRPICAGLMAGAFILETAYCKLLRVSHWKGLLSGLMVGVGGLAGVWAVNAAPSVLRLGNRRQEHSQRLERSRGGPSPRHQDRPGVVPMPRALFYLAGATAADVALLLV